MNNRLEIAKNIARSVHNNQTDKKGYPYLAHVFDVALRVKSLGESYEIVALLHDVIEDAEPGEFKLEIQKIINESFDPHIIEAIYALSRQPNEDYFEEYLVRLKKNKIAKTVKIADSSHNLSKAHLIDDDIEKQNKLRNKYIRVLDALDIEGKKQEIPLFFKDGEWKSH